MLSLLLLVFLFLLPSVMVMTVMTNVVLRFYEYYVFVRWPERWSRRGGFLSTRHSLHFHHSLSHVTLEFGGRDDGYGRQPLADVKGITTVRPRRTHISE